jgi:hypothetical protein
MALMAMAFDALKQPGLALESSQPQVASEPLRQGSLLRRTAAFIALKWRLSGGE